MSPLARDRYHLCKEEKQADLNFRNVSLHKFPKKVTKLKWLTKIVLAENLLFAIPERLNEFKKLQHLDLSSNQIEEGTEVLERLQTLTYLNLESNVLKEIPDLAACRGLQTLKLSANALPTLPPSLFANLQQLQEFTWATNMVPQVPKSIGNLKQLMILDLSNNPITDLEPIFACTELRTLIIQNTQAASVPDAIGQLTKLTELDVSNSLNLQSLSPALFSSGIPLVELRASQCALQTLDSGVGSLGQLKKLDMSSNALTDVPWQIGLCLNMEIINLSNNKITELPYQIGYLHKTLRKLLLNGTLIETFPGEICYFTPVIDLQTSRCPLKQPFHAFSDDPPSMIKAAKPLVKAYPPTCTFDGEASARSRVQTMSQFTIRANDILGNPLEKGGTEILACAVRRTPQNEATAAADPARREHDPARALAQAASGTDAGAGKQEDVQPAQILGQLTHGLASVGSAVHPSQAEDGTVENLVVKDLQNGTYEVFYNIATPGVYDLWCRIGEIAFGSAPSLMVIDP